MRILVAEDNAVNQMVVRSMLEKLGCRPRIVADGAAAVAEFDRARPDLILMDISMPEVDGMAATKMIREREAAARAVRTPVIGATAHSLREDRQSCIEAGMDDHLPKPIRLAALEAMLREWLSEKFRASS